MSEAIKRMLHEREQAGRAHEAGLRRELVRRLVEARKQLFVHAFERMQRYHRARSFSRHSPVPNMPLETMAVCEGAELAADQGWLAERAWQFSETRERALAEVEAELERRRGQ
jgi:hypothetical protein